MMSIDSGKYEGGGFHSAQITKMWHEFIAKNIPSFIAGVATLILLLCLAWSMFAGILDKNWPYIGPLFTLFAGVLVGKKF